MKNKIIITALIATLGLAIYFLYYDIDKAKNQLSYSNNISINTVPFRSENYNKRHKTRLSKKSIQRGKQISNGNYNMTSFNNDYQVREKNIFSDIDFPNLANNQPLVNLNRKRNNNESDYPEIRSSAGIFLTQRSRRSTSSNLNLKSSSYYSSSVTPTQGILMRGTEAIDDIIIDPGNDPDPGTMVPIGDGFLLMLLCSILYLFYNLKIKEM